MSYQGNIDWGNSVSHKWRLVVVNQPTWTDGAVVSGAMEVSVTRDRDGDLLESGSATIAMGIEEVPNEFIGRIEVLAEQGITVERHPVSTMRFIPGRSIIHAGRKVVDYDCFSVLRPADTRKMEAGAYVPKGTDGAAWIVKMLSECMRAPVSARQSSDSSSGSSRLAFALSSMSAGSVGSGITTTSPSSVTRRHQPIELSTSHTDANLLELPSKS